MTHLFLHLLFAGLLLMPGQQGAAESEPSVADIARAARDRQKSSNSSQVLTNDDITEKQNGPDSPRSSENDAKVRAWIDSWYPPLPTAALLQDRLNDVKTFSKETPSDFLAKFKQLHAADKFHDVNFPGKQEWEEEFTAAVNHFAEAAQEVAPRLQAVLERNQDLLMRRDNEGLKKVRAEWIDALMPFAYWQFRTTELIQNLQNREKGYLDGNQSALADYRRSHAKAAESEIGWDMIKLRDDEIEFRRVNGRFSCDLRQLAKGVGNESQVKYIEGARELGYRVTLQSCDAGHFQALAVPPAADGTQGRAFCVDDDVPRGIRIAESGATSDCLTRGRLWQGY